MKLTRITSEFSYGDWIIHKFGISKEGNPIHVRSDFRDWFYFDVDHIDDISRYDRFVVDFDTTYKSIYGNDCYRVEYTSIKDKNRAAKALKTSPHMYESDVRPEFKYLVTNNLEWADAKDRNIGYFDIETYTDDHGIFYGPDNPKAPITSIQIYLTKQKRYFIFAWHETETDHILTPEIVKKEDRTYVFCRDEVDVILSFIEFMKEYKVDILTGWYSKGFDLPYLMERCVLLDIDYNELSPVGRVSHRQQGFEWKTYIDGIDHIDMMEAVGEIGYNLPNNKLATAAIEILKDPDIEKITDVTWENWKEDFSGFMKYGLRDVEILKEIDEALGIFDLFCKVQQITNITQLSDISFKSSVVDKFILSECKNEYVFPTRVTGTKQKYMGAIVLDPVPGLHENIGIVDYASLYPTSIMSFNLSPETFICSQKQVEDMDMTIEQVIEELDKKNVKYVDTGYSDELVGKRYLFYSQETRLGMLPRILKKMYEERVRIKKEMKSEKDPVHHNALDKHQYALKIILNSAYGAFGFNFFRLYKVEVADAITFFARRALEYAITQLETQGYDVIYGDTDSCFFNLKSSNLEQPDFDDGFIDAFNENLKEWFIPEYNNGSPGDYAMMKLEWEKDMERIYFSKSKKRYYGIERNTGKKYIRGLNIIRKDAPPFLKKKLNEYSEMAIMGNLTLQNIIDLREEVESQPYETIGVTKAYGKSFDKYKNKAAHVKGALFANEILGTNITHKDTPLLFYIVSNCEDDLKPKDRHQAICLLPDDLHYIDDSDLFEIDYDVYFAKQVIIPIKEFVHIDYIKVMLDEYKKHIS